MWRAAAENKVECKFEFLTFAARLTDPRERGPVVSHACETAGPDFPAVSRTGPGYRHITTLWPKSEEPRNRPRAQMRAFETKRGGPAVRQGISGFQCRRFAGSFADWCFARTASRKPLTGNGDFFPLNPRPVSEIRQDGRQCLAGKSPLAVICARFRNMPGEALSPAWAPDGRFVVFSHIDPKSHTLGVGDRSKRQGADDSLSGNVVIGPAFTPDNKVGVAPPRAGTL